jgi:hypothetical protein
MKSLISKLITFLVKFDVIQFELLIAMLGKPGINKFGKVDCGGRP